MVAVDVEDAYMGNVGWLSLAGSKCGEPAGEVCKRHACMHACTHGLVCNRGEELHTPVELPSFSELATSVAVPRNAKHLKGAVCATQYWRRVTYMHVGKWQRTPPAPWWFQ